MVELLIDGKKVRLSGDMSFEFLDRNPLFTKEGRHSLDIDIDLGDPVNANIYKNMYRIDVLQRPSGRSAVLYNERGVILRGTEVVLQIDERVAKIQLVSGNSELNYLSGGDCLMRDLDLGEIRNLTASVAWNSLSGSYPTWDYVCTPVCTRTTFYKDVVPVVSDDALLMNEVVRDGSGCMFKADTTLCPQPYLAAMVRRVIDALGYTLRTDFIGTHADLKKLILVNGYHSVRYNEMVPNWKVDDFLSEVEKLTGCIFLVSQMDKTVDIVQMNSFYEDSGVEEIPAGDVIGEVGKHYDEESPEGVLYHNISYKFPSTEIYKYWSVDRDFLNSLTIQQCPNLGTSVPSYRYFQMLIDIWKAIAGDQWDDQAYLAVPDNVRDAYNKMIAYEDLGMPSFGTYFVMRSAEERISHMRRLNYYGSRYDDRTDDTMELKIVPSEVVWRNEPDLVNMEYCWCQPYLLARNADTDTTVTSEDTKGLNDYISEGFTDDTSDVLYVAFYLGFKDTNYILNGDNAILSPVAVPSNEVERFYADNRFVDIWKWWQLQEVVNFGEPGCCLAINGDGGMYKRFWKNNLPVNFTQPYTILFRNTKNHDPRNLFVIANKKFYCEELKYRVDGGRLSDIVEGTFFPLMGDDTQYAGETINIQVKVETSTGYVKLVSDKRLDYPLTIQLTGVAGQSTYSTLIRMQAGTFQKSIWSEWVMDCGTFTASVYEQESDDANTYALTVVATSYDVIDIELTLQGGSVLATASHAVNSATLIVLRVTYEDGSDEITLTIAEGGTTARGTSSRNLDDRTDASAVAYALGAGDDTRYRVTISPYDAEVEYLESSGTQWIDIDHGLTNVGNYSFTVEYDAISPTTSGVAVCGSATGNTSWTGVLWSNNRFYLGSGGVVLNENCGRTSGVRTEFTCDVVTENNVNKLAITNKFGGNTYQQNAQTNGVASNNSWLLFAYFYNNAVSGKISAKMYHFLLKDGGDVVRDMIPVRVGQVGYMYDRVSGELFGNAGTGAFVVGPDKAD